MIRKIIVAVLLLGAAALSTAASIEIIEEALELTTEQVSLPSSESGSVGIRRCADCLPERMRLGSATEFRIGKERVSLAQLRLASRSRGPIYIFFDAREGFVTRIILEAPRRRAERAIP